MKKIISIFLSATIVASAFALPVFAENHITVEIDGRMLDFDTQPFIENDYTLVPMRAIFEALGAEVTWNGDNRTVTAVKTHEDHTDSVSLTIGDKEMSIVMEDAVRSVELGAPAKIVNDRTFVPLRAVSEAFDCDVQWNGETETVTITSGEKLGIDVSEISDDTYASRFMSFLPQDENAVISPLSLKMAMMMAANGAGGDTQKEILDAFDVDNIEEYNASAKELISRLNENDKGKVNIANSIWFNTDYYANIENADFSDSFKNIISSLYGGEASKVTNQNSVEAVNEWVEKQTNGKIKDLLTNENREYLLALVNAVYMKAEWQNKFKSGDTYNENFTDIDGNVCETEFMHKTDHFDYYDNGDTKMICMPYSNGLSMYIALGDIKNFEDAKNSMTERRVELSIPKFKTEYSITLNEILENMGVKNAFDPTVSNFSTMTENISDPLYIKTVLQKAVIEVDEEGTEAAAATAVIMETTSALLPIEEKTVEFKANKPFTYYITDDETGEVLFAGNYVKCN